MKQNQLGLKSQNKDKINKSLSAKNVKKVSFSNLPSFSNDFYVNGSSNSSRGERSLWRAVIMQALIDSVSISKRTEKVLARESAIKWFDLSNQHFLSVCLMADLQPEYVIKKSKFAIQNYSQWKRNLSLNELHAAQDQVFSQEQEVLD